MNRIRKIKQTIEKNQGITLIALVITIIVLLILASISIATLVGENGILTKATIAEEKTIKAQLKEEIELDIVEIQLEETEKSNQITLETLTERLADKGTVGTIINNEIIGEYKSYQFNIDENFKVTIQESDMVVNGIYHVSNKGNDDTGNGSIKKPYASLKKAIQEAKTGNTIKIEEGIYNLEPVEADSNALAGIFDETKELLIYGENEKTILKYDATISTKRDAPAFFLANANTIVRNLVVEFQPRKITEGEYQVCLFKWCKGTIENVFIRTIGVNKCSYLYYNEQVTPNNVKNCTFYHDLGAVNVNYSGVCNFNNIATNVQTNGTNTNVITKNFGNANMELVDLIKASKEEEDFIKNQVGVYYGTYAWK